MFKSSSTKRLVISAVAMTLVAVGIYALVFSQVRSTNRSVAVYKNEINSVLEKDSRLRFVKNIIKNSEADRAQIDTYFVGEDAVVDFIETVENMEIRTGTKIDITSVSIDDIADSEVGELLRLNFNTEGTWEGLFRLLTLVEALPLKVTLTYVNFDNISPKKTGLVVASESNDKLEEKVKPTWKGTFGLTVLKLK